MSLTWEEITKTVLAHWRARERVLPEDIWLPDVNGGWYVFDTIYRRWVKLVEFGY
jgi:hypothetical protein